MDVYIRYNGFDGKIKEGTFDSKKIIDTILDESRKIFENVKIVDEERLQNIVEEKESARENALNLLGKADIENLLDAIKNIEDYCNPVFLTNNNRRLREVNDNLDTVMLLQGINEGNNVLAQKLVDKFSIDEEEEDNG